MVAKSAKSASEPSSPAAGSKRFKGVRMRSWGKWVSEIRLPNTRARLWLGSYATAEQAARAYDVAVACLRGSSASLNFPDSPPVYATVGLPHDQIQELAAAAAAAVAPAPPSLSSAKEESCDSGSQLDSLLTSPARSTFADESEAATPQIDASSQCSSPVSTPPDDCAFGNLLSQDFSSPPEFLNSEWDMILADELQSGVFGFSHWEQYISGITVCDSITHVPLLDDEYSAFAEPCLWSL